MSHQLETRGTEHASHRIAFAIAALLSIFTAWPVLADGEVVITQAKALAGNVTPGDTAGFPVTLSQPGAYTLGSNLTVPGYTYGIIATSHNVDIDLNGFRLVGNNFGTYGVVSNYGESRIHGGVINTFRNAGIYIRNNAWTIEDMQIVRNGGSGIDATGARLIEVRNSLITANGYFGVVTGDDGLFRNNRITDNTYMGIQCQQNCQAEGNIIDKNQYGIEIASGLVIGNTISRSVLEGLFDDNLIDTGVVNNIFINNNAGSIVQMIRGVDVHPNACIGNPCR